MGKRLCFATLALLIPAAVQAQGLESLLSSIEEANEDKLNPVAEHPPLTAPPFLAPVGLPLQQFSSPYYSFLKQLTTQHSLKLHVLE